jgi:radical SAM protein with 4Fe4S-binding SPASM domain
MSAPTTPHASPTTPLPSFVQIEPVGQCNLRCQMCPIQFRTDGPPNGPPAFMPFETFTRLVDQLPSMTELQLQGLGEPLMHPRFFDMVAYATARGVEVSTNSNLTLLTPARAERLVTSGLHRLQASIDGATPETYERIRVRSNWQRVVRNLEGLVEAKRRLGSALPRVSMVVVVMRQNLHELEDLVRLSARVGVESVFVQHLCHDFGEETLPAHYRPMHQFVAAQTLLGEDPARVEDAFAAARAAAAALGVELRLPRVTPRPAPLGTRGPDRCDLPWRGAYFSYDGQAMPCCMVATPDRINFGNAAEAGVVPIWESAEYEAFRARLDSDEPPEICRSCAVYNRTF